jgi:hypothetical protein
MKKLAITFGLLFMSIPLAKAQVYPSDLTNFPMLICGSIEKNEKIQKNSRLDYFVGNIYMGSVPIKNKTWGCYGAQGGDVTIPKFDGKLSFKLMEQWKPVLNISQKSISVISGKCNPDHITYYPRANCRIKINLR